MYSASAQGAGKAAHNRTRHSPPRAAPQTKSTHETPRISGTEQITVAVPRSGHSHSDNLPISTTSEHLASNHNLEIKALLPMAEKIYQCMSKAYYELYNVREHITTQDSEHKPLYQWTQYTHFKRLDKAASALDNAVQQFKDAVNEFDSERVDRDILTRLLELTAKKSSSTSNLVHSIFQVVNRKTEHCLEEIDASVPSRLQKDKAKQDIRVELEKLRSHTKITTDAVYAAVDQIEDLIHGPRELMGGVSPGTRTRSGRSGC